MSEALYRIIDANFNRSREALRGMEEYCRFLLDDKALAEDFVQVCKTGGAVSIINDRTDN